MSGKIYTRVKERQADANWRALMARVRVEHRAQQPEGFTSHLLRLGRNWVPFLKERQ